MSENSDNSLGSSSPAGQAGQRGEPVAKEASFTRAELRALSAEIPDRLPAEDLMETRLVLVDVDPCHVHVYWHVRAEDLAMALDALATPEGDYHLQLRLHDAVCTLMVGFIPWPPLELEVTGLDGYRHVEIPDCGKTLIAELGLRGVNGSFIRLASSRPVRLPAAGREAGVISERVELVLVDEPGSPPQVVEVAPQHTEPAEAGHAGRESQPRDPEATTDRASPGRSAFARTGPGGVMIAPRRVINSVFSGADYYRQPWSWSGGPMPGSSSGESD
jgi:hypothetical protein